MLQKDTPAWETRRCRENAPYPDNNINTMFSCFRCLFDQTSNSRYRSKRDWEAITNKYECNPSGKPFTLSTEQFPLRVNSHFTRLRLLLTSFRHGSIKSGFEKKMINTFLLLLLIAAIPDTAQTSRPGRHGNRGPCNRLNFTSQGR